MPCHVQVEQLHRIFKLCGTPSEDYWKKLRLSTTFRPPKTYKPCLFEAFGSFPESSLGLLTSLLALDPAQRGTASSALQNEVSIKSEDSIRSTVISQVDSSISFIKCFIMDPATSDFS